MEYITKPFYSPPLTKLAAMRSFIAGLHRERAWLKAHPEAKEYTRVLTEEECTTLGVLPGSSVTGKRDAGGGILWCITAVQPGSEPHVNN